MENKKSLIFAIEEIAILLRKKAKTERTPLKRPTVSSSGLSNRVEQVAQMLRQELRALRSKKKRAWTRVKKEK
jgi:hypothetical protein